MRQMLALAIETATTRGGISLGTPPGPYHTILFDQGMVHGREVAPAIDRALTEISRPISEIDLICCDIGPGSYTGLRVGLAYAKTLAWALSKPISSVVSLDALARRYARAHPDLPQGAKLRPALDAKWDQIYTAEYEIRSGEARRTAEPRPALPAELSSDLGIVFGDALTSLLKANPSPSFDPDPAHHHPHPVDILELGVMKFEARAADSLIGLEPLYLRPTEAELKRPRP